MSDMNRLRAVSHPLRLRILFALDAQGEARTSDLASELGVAPNKVSYHLSLMEKAGLLEKRVGEDARETWWSVIDEKMSIEAEGDGQVRAEDGRTSTLAALEYLRSLVPGPVPAPDGSGPRQAVMLTNAYLTEEQMNEITGDMVALVERARSLSQKNREEGNGRLYALGAQLLPARAELG